MYVYISLSNIYIYIYTHLRGAVQPGGLRRAPLPRLRLLHDLLRAQPGAAETNQHLFLSSFLPLGQLNKLNISFYLAFVFFTIFSAHNPAPARRFQ